MNLGINAIHTYYNNTNSLCPSYVTKQSAKRKSYHTSFKAYTNPLYNKFNQKGTVQFPKTIQDPEIMTALTYLGEIRNQPRDVLELSKIGVKPLYNSGQEALNFILKNNIKVEFGDLGDSQSHAIWVNEDKKIVINKKYQGNMTQESALAISEAIYHEAGHAKDLDNVSSIQEELECLALNALAYNFHKSSYLQYNENQKMNGLISNGVALYARLFFDNDPNKTNLMNRVAEKYGNLPIESQNHPVVHGSDSFAYKIKDTFTKNT